MTLGCVRVTIDSIMCRLFGFRSVIPSQVHRSLLDADNALGNQSNEHPDGWGVAHYAEGIPHLTRSSAQALGDEIFHKLSGVVASETVLAHVRKATVGNISVLNCHPFQYGPWAFAHNGEIPGFDSQRETFTEQVAEPFRRFILGDTDSEVLFFLFLTELIKDGQRVGCTRPARQVGEALRNTVELARSLWVSPKEGAKILLTLMVTDGSSMLAYRSGKELHWSTYKTRCADRGTCSSLSSECEAPTQTGRVNHFIVSSEPLQGENVWLALEDEELIGVDAGMNLIHQSRAGKSLPVVA